MKIINKNIKINKPIINNIYSIKEFYINTKPYFDKKYFVLLNEFNNFYSTKMKEYKNNNIDTKRISWLSINYKSLSKNQYKFPLYDINNNILEMLIINFI